MGVRQPDREDSFTPFGVSDKEWNQQVNQTRGNLNNFALYNAPPGTWQRMPVYFYLSPEDSHATQEAVIRYTHDDVYKPMPGFKVLVSHFHFNEELTDAGTFDTEPPWMPAYYTHLIKEAGGSLGSAIHRKSSAARQGVFTAPRRPMN